MKLSIAVAGSAKAHTEPKKIEQIAFELGKEIAEQNALLVFGVEHSRDHLHDIVYEGLRQLNVSLNACGRGF